MLRYYFSRRFIEEALLLLAYHIVRRAARIAPKPALVELARQFDHCREVL